MSAEENISVMLIEHSQRLNYLAGVYGVLGIIVVLLLLYAAARRYHFRQGKRTPR